MEELEKNIILGIADWDIIKKVKEAVNIPVIGNGDIKSKEDALEMFEKTNADGIMIGRAALGNPWIFKEIISFLKNEKIEQVSIDEKLNTIIKHIELEVEQKGENVGIKELRKHMCAYIKNMPDATTLRQKVNEIETKNELIACITEYFNKIRI
jgi:tRNA-dihydrouridine synthase